jgi:hypothetical protein
MKKSIFSLSVVLLFLVFTAGGCKKTTSEPSGGAPTVPSVTFSAPALDTSVCGQQAYFLVQFANLYSTQFAVFAALPPTSSGNDYTWSLPLDSLTVTVKATRQGDGSFTWEIKYNGTEDGVAYSNKVTATGSSSADGKSGSFTAYDDASAGVVGTFAWSTSPSNVVTGTFIEKDTPGGNDAYKIEVISNANGSGETSAFHATAPGTWALYFHATWAAAGAPAVCS